MSTVTHKLLTPVVIGLAAGLLAQQASATEEMVVYGSAAAAGFRVGAKRVSGGNRELHPLSECRVPDYARSGSETHADAEARAREHRCSRARLRQTQTSGHHSSPRGARWPSRTAVPRGAGFPAANMDMSSNEEYGCSCTRPPFFCATVRSRDARATPQRAAPLRFSSRNFSVSCHDSVAAFSS